MEAVSLFFFPEDKGKLLHIWTYTCVCCMCMQVEPVVIRYPQSHRSLWEQQETCRGQKTAWKERGKKRWGSKRGTSDLLSKPCICITFVILYLLTKRCLQDDYQSADTNPADFKLPFTMIRKRFGIWITRGWDLFRSHVFFLLVCFFVQPASVKLRWMLHGWFMSTVTTHTNLENV